MKGHTMNNVYYTPNNFGLEMIVEVDWTPGEPYEFNMTCVWRDKTGQLYMASDSGCSCPSPFEDFQSLDKLDKVSKHEAVKALKEKAANYSNGLSLCATAIERIFFLKDPPGVSEPVVSEEDENPMVLDIQEFQIVEYIKWNIVSTHRESFNYETMVVEYVSLYGHRMPWTLNAMDMWKLIFRHEI